MGNTRTCRMCGCTDLSACVEADGSPCWWIDDDLCSACERYLCDPLLCEVGEERFRQDRRWGGPDNDDKNTAQDWHDILYRLLDEAERAHRAGDGAEYRRVLIQVAAVAVAAVGAHDRRADAVRGE